MKIKTLTLMATAAFIAGSGITRAAQPSVRSNIVFIISDDQAWSDYGFMGHPKIATPHLDKLAAGSLTFRRMPTRPMPSPRGRNSLPMKAECARTS